MISAGSLASVFRRKAGIQPNNRLWMRDRFAPRIALRWSGAVGCRAVRNDDLESAQSSD
jgi:hypothetical protein